jgi:CHAD domain-containing protein
MTEPGALDPIAAERMPLPLLPPERAVRKLLLRQLRQAEGAGQRLAVGEDPDALHDFRVALRRFRATERAYRPCLGEALPKKLRKRLQELVRSTGPARDSEVQLEWLRQQAAALRPNQRPGYQWLRRRVEDRQRRAYAAIRGAVPMQFVALGTLLRGALAMPAESSPRSFAAAAAEQLRPLAAELSADFAALGEDAGMSHVHAARLLVKRARYVLEPVAPALEQGRELSRELAGLQELLGAMHDAEVLGLSLGDAAAEAGAARYRALVAGALGEAADDSMPLPRRRGDERAGLTALAQQVQAQMRSGRAALLDKIRSGEVARLLQRLDQAAATLAALQPATVVVPAAALR